MANTEANSAQHATRAIIVGAGIGGLTAALALLRRGVDVDVYERASILTEIGAGLHCSPNGSRVLIELGLQDAMTSIAVIPTSRDVRLWNTGEIWQLNNHGSKALERYGAPYVVMHRGDLQAMLVAALKEIKPDAIHLGAACKSVEQDSHRAIVNFEDGTNVAGDFVVAADGVHSTLRRALFKSAAPTFTGVTAWRGLVPIERLPGISAETATNWIGPDGSITLYGVRGGKLLNFVALKAHSAWQAESWVEAGTVSDCLADFAGWHEDIQRIIRNIDTPYKWGLFLHEPASRWTAGRVALLGDSAHATLPYLGQGANMALEDAMVLSRCIADARSDSRGDADFPGALQKYDRARSARCARIVHQSAEQGKRVGNPALRDPDGARAYIEKIWSADSVAQWYDWIFDYDATTVAIEH